MLLGAYVENERWHVWAGVIGGAIAGIADTIVNSLPSKYAGPVPDYRYQILDGASALAFFVLLIALVFWVRVLARTGYRGPIYARYVIWGLLSFVIADLGSHAYAVHSIGGDDTVVAVREALSTTVLAPLGTVPMVAPFVFLSLISASVAKAGKSGAANLLFATGVAILGWLYFSGHMDAQQSLLRHKWTAAALSVGLLPFKSAFILAIWYVISLPLARGGVPMGPTPPAATTPAKSMPIAVKAAKRRGVYVVLGLLLGVFGGHNFYARYDGRGIVQLFITLLLGPLFVGIAITGIWVIIELFAITRDAEGNPFL